MDMTWHVNKEDGWVPLSDDVGLYIDLLLRVQYDASIVSHVAYCGETTYLKYVCVVDGKRKLIVASPCTFCVENVPWIEYRLYDVETRTFQLLWKRP